MSDDLRAQSVEEEIDFLRTLLKEQRDRCQEHREQREYQLREEEEWKESKAKIMADIKDELRQVQATLRSKPPQETTKHLEEEVLKAQQEHWKRQKEELLNFGKGLFSETPEVNKEAVEGKDSGQ